MTATQTASTQFQGYFVNVTRQDSGASYVAWVENESTGQKTGAKIFKIRERVYAGIKGNNQTAWKYGNSHNVYAKNCVRVNG